MVLLLLGAVAFSTRYSVRQHTETALQDSRWKLKYDVAFDVTGTRGTVRVGLPSPTPTSAASIESEFLSYTGLLGDVRVSSLTGSREFVGTTSHTDSYQVVAEFDIRLSPRDAVEQHHPFQTLTTASRSRYIRSEEQFPIQGPRVQRVLQDLTTANVTEAEMLQRIFDYSSQAFKPTTALDGGDDVGYAIANQQATPLGRARAMVTLCRAARIPARLVTGFELRQTEVPTPHVWVEVFQKHRWIPFDPTFGYARQMPYYFVVVRRDGDTVVRGEGVANLVSTYTIMRLPPTVQVLNTGVRRPSQIFDLTRLPVEMHEIMSLILLLPFGALITAIFRNLIGIRTLGTFAPALLALSFIYAAWGTGLVILVVVLIAGLVGRNLLERLHLLMVPRSSIVLTLIILCVVFSLSLIDYAAPETKVRAVLLPLVILTLLIERFFVTSEEDGMRFAIQLVLGTAVVASCCYLILGWPEIGDLILIYPELHLFTIAGFIWIGRYSGYRLIELWRFRDIAKDIQP